MIPSMMIRDLVGERSYYRDEAKQSIAASWTGGQKLLGPVLVVPYVERIEDMVWDTDKERQHLVKQANEKRLFVLPSILEIDAKVRTEERSRGIYAIPVYESAIDVQGVFENKRILALLKDEGVTVHWDKAFLSMPVSDIRGIVVEPVLRWNGGDHEFVSGSGIGPQGGGMQAGVDGLDVSQPARFTFGFSVRVHGMETLQFSPVGKNNRVTVQSAWRHPSFLGRYLPSKRTIDENGFRAEWRISSFSGDMARVSALCETGKCDQFFNNTFGVALIQPVDIYHQAERSVKYAILIISLTFVAFFLFEVMRSIQLHPMQYLLVGCSLTVFYLLLVSLSEHIAFAWAYLIASLANATLLGVYISAVLNSRLRGLVLMGSLLALYSMLYLILRSEDNALLMGSLLIFAVLAFVMLLTRNLDWYRVSERVAGQAAWTPRGSSGANAEPLDSA
jgi:inner membrane protein